ncbi:MAG: ABC transporter permease [Clostridia bacterium]|nr:ABC transporter permease [Clostridia bacterium]
MNTKTLLYIAKRILLALLTVWVVITVTFFATRLVPGDPFLAEKSLPEVAKQQLEEKYGLDKPVHEQYFNYLLDVTTKFDFGPSLKKDGRMVIDIITDGMKTSVKLGLTAAFAALVSGTILGSVAALNRNKLIDRIIMVITTAFVSMPSFVIGSILLYWFSVQLRWFPANGDTAAGYVLPVITLALYPMAYITRLTRSSMLDVLGQDYIRTAKAKGVSKFKIIFGHALKNSLIPVITYFGPMLAYITTGSLVVEQIFNVPGVGRAFVNSITGRDYTLIMGTTIVLATLIVVMNLVSDILYKVVDPRITLE